MYYTFPLYAEGPSGWLLETIDFLVWGWGSCVARGVGIQLCCFQSVWLHPEKGFRIGGWFWGFGGQGGWACPGLSL